MLDPLEIPRSKTKTLGNSTLFFLGHPWKFHFVFNEPLKIPYLAISLISLEIPYPQPHPPPSLDFFWNRLKESHFRSYLPDKSQILGKR